MNDLLTVLYLVLLATATVPVTWGPIQYGLRSPWRATPTGRTLFWTLLSLALAVDLTAVFNLMAVTGGPAPLTLAVLAMAFLNWAAWRMVRTIRDAQRCDTDNTDDTDSPEQETRHP